MSGDEVIVTLASLVVGSAAGRCGSTARRRSRPCAEARLRSSLLASTLGLLGLLIFAFLRFCAADDVREAPEYLFMYFVIGLAWMRVAAMVFPLAGLHPHDDIIERRNAAAVPAWIGAMTGVALCYSGANVGNGPGWWVVVFSAGLATASLGACLGRLCAEDAVRAMRWRSIAIRRRVPGSAACWRPAA